MKKCVHVNSYFLSNAIHYNLYKELKSRKDDQFLIPVYKFFREKHIDGIDIDYVFTSIDKKIFFTKIPKVVFLFFKKKLRNFDYIHSHTVISDGIPGVIISYITRKPLVVSVRNTDISLFINGSIVFKLVAKLILKKSQAVFFISPSLKKKIQNLYPDIDSSKYYLLPNGLDNYWVQNRALEPKRLSNRNEIKLLFVGEIIPRKNLTILLNYLHEYTDYKYELNVVGKNTDNIDFISLSDSITNENRLIYHGPIYEKEKLKALYRDCEIFLLLSFAETFGVVYIEALSQGLPIIFSRDEGLDGFFPNGKIGYSSDPNSLKELHQNVMKIISNYEAMSANALMASRSFEWENIADNYINIVDQNL